MAAIRQECNDVNGCFMQNNHPKLEDFDGSFGTNPPRNIQFSDIDGTVEVDGYFLFTEFKSHTEISNGQRLYYERLTRVDQNGERIVVLHVVGEAAKRTAEAYRECINGRWGDWVDCDWQSLRTKIQSFAEEAKARTKHRILSARARRQAAQQNLHTDRITAKAA